MRLSLYDKQDQFVCGMDSETALLGSFPVDEGMRLHVSVRCSEPVMLLCG